jgi:hypothetical protein
VEGLPAVVLEPPVFFRELVERVHGCVGIGVVDGGVGATAAVHAVCPGGSVGGGQRDESGGEEGGGKHGGRYGNGMERVREGDGGTRGRMGRDDERTVMQKGNEA